ncbi:MAG: DUF1080 domain-containing protein [Pirellulaceae bacterium]
MTSFLRCGLTLLFAITAVQNATAQQAPAEPEGMQKLFNGKDLSGWDGDPRLWSVKDGVIHGETTAEEKANGNTFLIWDGQTKDFELRLSFRCNASNNSGIQYRSKHITDDKVKNKWVVRGYQHEIRNENAFPNVSGFIYGEGLGRGRICLAGEKAVIEDDQKTKKVVETLITDEEYKKLFKLDDWNDVIIVAKDNHIQHYMNGRLVLDFTDHPKLALLDGILALQLHAGNPMWAEFKDIRIKHFD